MSQHTSIDGALAQAIDKALVVEEIPYALRTYTPRDLGFRRLHPRYREDGPDALPLGTPREHLPASKGVRQADDDTTEFIQARELYRMRVSPHLYDDRMVEEGIALAHQRARAMGRLIADCRRCHTSTFVLETAERCVKCGTEYQ